MKCNAINVMMGIFLVILFVLAGCGGSGSATSSNNSFITSVGWIYENAAPDYTNNGPTCLLRVKVYYDESISAADIDSFDITAPNGWQWTIPASNSQSGTSSSGKPYIGNSIYYGANPHIMPLAGTWVFRLKLKNGQISSVQKTFHEPGSAADATHKYVYTAEDWTPSADTSQYIAALSRFTEQGYTLQYSAANGGSITTTGLAASRTWFLAAQPRAYNMVCWLYDNNKAYLGLTITEFSAQDHSRTNLINANGELSIVPASTVSLNGQVDLSAVKYLRFVYFDGAQYEPSSYSNMDYRSISPLVDVLPFVTGSPNSLGTKWNAIYSPVTTFLYGVVWSGSQFVAVGDTGTILTSSNGLTWMPRTSGSADRLQSIAWSGSKYAVVGGWGGNVLLSTDGITWSKVSTGVGKFLRKIIWANNQFVAVGMGTILTSPDGITWIERSVNTLKEISNVTWTGNQYVAIGGSNGTVCFTSPDGITWTSQSGLPSLFSGMLFGMAWNGSRMIASGWGGFFASSADGITWSSGTYGSNNLYAATWTNQHFIEVGDKGTIVTSADGNTWTSSQSNTTDTLSDIACSNNMCIVVGGTTTKSTILMSQ